MRDAQIFQMNQQRAQNDVVLYKQIHFMMTRVQAYEDVLLTRKAMLKAIFNPTWLKREVDKCQMRLLREHDEQVREASKKAKVTVLS